jgi:hypothetical protein
MTSRFKVQLCASTSLASGRVRIGRRQPRPISTAALQGFGTPGTPSVTVSPQLTVVQGTPSVTGPENA